LELFTKPDAGLKALISTHKKGREDSRISISVEYNGKRYRELIFFSPSILGKPKGRTAGLIYIDENNKVVSDKKIQRDLSVVFSYMEELFDDSFIKKLTKSVISEKSLKIEEAQSKFIEANLVYLSSLKIYGADKVKEIISKLPELKRDNNLAIEKFVKKMHEFKNVDGITYENVLKDIKPLYTDILVKNFEKIKLIGTGRNYYSDVKTGTKKIFKKKYLGLMGNKVEPGVEALNNELNHLIQVVKVYELIIGMTSTSEYIKYLNEMDKEQINKKIDKIRA
jgi:hypothetical protein